MAAFDPRWWCEEKLNLAFVCLPDVCMEICIFVQLMIIVLVLFFAVKEKLPHLLHVHVRPMFNLFICPNLKSQIL